jgi:hypothetical protein
MAAGHRVSASTVKGSIACRTYVVNIPSHIDAFGFCSYVALLVDALVERQLRNAIDRDGIDAFALNPEDRG